MIVSHHLFLSDTGKVLPHWQQAFADLKALRFADPVMVLPAPDIVWLRLGAERPFREQLLAAREQVGQHPYVVMSDLPNDDEALAVFALGARGYCNSHASAAVLQQIASVVLQGGLWIGASLMQRMVGMSAQAVSPAPTTPAKDLAALLTHRELEVAQIVVSGASNKEIAAKLGIAERTVKSHVGAIFEKLGVRDRLQLALLIRNQSAV
ncbi:MAG: response regulator transcription factor [Herminiimonas sp.]|uniref:helix-turn-helix transcriptional regulator n=1 Tax=Herminiimonas sp. TaxID=1926289 RepID=UPI00271C85EE|nr:response regulator transcription factor [Herminiimonas sp.]MDO9422065.1 response regulator transcription factor [Herminiimonas sp.]